MKSASLSTIQSFDQVSIDCIVFEKGDDAFLFSCELQKGERTFFSNLIASFDDLNDVLGIMNNDQRSEFYGVSEQLLSSEDFISEIRLKSPIILKSSQPSYDAYAA